MIHRGFPTGQRTRREVLADPWRQEAAGPQTPQTHGLHHHGQQGNDALQKEVEEQDGGRTTQKTVEDQENLPSYGHRGGHPKSCREANKKSSLEHCILLFAI